MAVVRFIKKYFAIILLFILSISVGILSMVTFLRLREFRSAAPSETSALTPPCSFTFTIEDTTPQQKTLPSPSPAQVLSPQPIQPTSTPSPTSTPTALPTKTVGGLQTLPTSTPTPLVLAQAPTATPTPETPPPSPTPIESELTESTVSATATPTSPAQPELPISGISIPTTVVLLFGLMFLFLGALAVI